MYIHIPIQRFIKHSHNWSLAHLCNPKRNEPCLKTRINSSLTRCPKRRSFKPKCSSLSYVEFAGWFPPNASLDLSFVQTMVSTHATILQGIASQTDLPPLLLRVPFGFCQHLVPYIDRSTRTEFCLKDSSGSVSAVGRSGPFAG